MDNSWWCTICTRTFYGIVSNSNIHQWGCNYYTHISLGYLTDNKNNNIDPGLIFLDVNVIIYVCLKCFQHLTYLVILVSKDTIITMDMNYHLRSHRFRILIYIAVIHILQPPQCYLPSWGIPQTRIGDYWYF